MTTPQNMYALLVGINEYANPNITRLGGCVNDIDAMEQLLRDRYSVPTQNIKKLTNQQATHQAIKEAFKTHLIAQARAWADAGQSSPAPAFLFHYSGHGSQTQARSGTKPDDQDETIVPYDSRINDVCDIKDWEIGQMLDELNKYAENVTVFLDCCNSGSGTRDIGKGVVPTRRCEPDLRPQPEASLCPVNGTAITQKRSVTNESGWILGGKYVLLAACRDREEANEHLVPGVPQHGVMTFFLLQELQKMVPEQPLTYRELYERIRDKVNAEYDTQMPQCEGDRDRLVFNGLRPARDISLTVQYNPKKGYYGVDGGVAHGLTEGTQLHVYPPETRTLKEAGSPLATLRVVEVGAVQSDCEVEEGSTELPNQARAFIHRINYGDMQQRVVLDIATDTLLCQVEARLGEKDAEPYIKLVPKGSPADLRVEQKGKILEIQDRTGKRLVAPFALNQLDDLARDLNHLVRYQNALKLQNSDNSELAGKIGLAVKQLAFDRGNPITTPLATAGQTANAEQEAVIEVGQNIVFEVTNNSSEKLYITVLNFTHDWGITQLYPRTQGENKLLPAGRTLSLGLSKERRDKLAAWLPDGVVEAREFIKVIATIDEANFEILQQKPLKTAYTRAAPDTRSATTRSALMALLEQVMDGRDSSAADTRGFGPPAASVEDAWTTSQMSFRLVQPINSQQVSQKLSGGQKTTWASYDLQIEPPANFQGEIRILTQRQSTRTAGGAMAELAPPPGLASFGAMFQPVEVQTKATRNVGPGGAVIELDADDTARRAVTKATPLKMRLPAEMVSRGETMLALAYDGSFFYPVGRPGDETDILNVEWLPEVTPADEISTRSTRNLGRTVKLYLFKMAGWPEPSLGLHLARFIPTAKINDDQPEADERRYTIGGGEARYRDLRSGDLQSGQRVALFVHGFTSETHWMVGGIIPWLAANGLAYDRYLAFDYETFNTRISENGQTLTNLLRAAGFGPDDNIHLDVFAHSMGTQVTRSMVEQHGGDAFVDRCFLAGPPNQGTRLAEAKRLVPWLGTLLLNQAGPTPPSIIASWVLKKVADDAVGGDDLRPGSDFYQALNDADRPAKVPYYILAGRQDLPIQYKSAWDRVAKTFLGAADAGLDMLFGDQHDMVINVQSMLTVRNGNYPAALLHKRVVGCNHFQYFYDSIALDILFNWLKKNE